MILLILLFLMCKLMMNSSGWVTPPVYLHYRQKTMVVNSYTKIWQRYVPPKISIFVRRCLHNRLPTDHNANVRGVTVDGGCILWEDIVVPEDQEHIQLRCDFAKLVWNWVSSLLLIDINFIPSVRELIRWCSRRSMKEQNDQVL